MHRAVQIHRRNSVAMWLEHALDDCRIGNVGGAFVVNHEVIILGVIRMAQDSQRGLGRGIVRMNLSDNDVGAFFQSLLQDVLLFCVIVAATARDKQNPYRRGR
jgi:hypothetical protein